MRNVPRYTGRLTALLWGLPRILHGAEETSLEYVSPWGPGITILLVLAAALLCFALYRREQSEAPPGAKWLLAALRFSLFCLVLWMMYGFTLRPFRTDLPDLLLVLDNSQSMETVDAWEDDATQATLREDLQALQLPTPSRFHQIQSLLLRNDAQLLRRLMESYQVRLVTLETYASELSQDAETLQSAIRAIKPDQEASPLGETLRRTLQRQRGRPIAAVIYFTDGITTDGPPLSQAAVEAAKRNAPLHVVALGSDRPAKDVGLRDLLVDDVVFVGDLIPFDFTLSQHGYGNQSVAVSLARVDGTGEVVRQDIALSETHSTQAVRLAFRAEEEGTLDFVVQTPALPEEVSLENNKLVARVQVRKETIRVLLVQAYPSYEYRYLKTLLSRTAQRDVTESNPIRLDVLLQQADPELAEIDDVLLRRFPTREELFAYDVCIFGDVNPSLLGSEALRHLRDFVRVQGRGFIGIAGPRFFPAQYAGTPLAELVPFDIASSHAAMLDAPLLDGFQPRLTPLGERMPAMQLSTDLETNRRLWAELPEIYWMLEAERVKPGVRVLSVNPQRLGPDDRPLPLTMLFFVGAGKVLFQTTEESWRWRIGRGDPLHARFWNQSIRYLSRFKLGEGRNVELTSDRETYRRGDEVLLRARFFDDRTAPTDNAGVRVILEQQGRGQQQVLLQRDAADRGVFTAQLSDLSIGNFHGWISDPSASQAASVDFKIIAPDNEATHIQTDTTDLRQAAKRSGGRFYTYREAASMLRYLPRGRRVRIESLAPVPIWNTWKTAAAFVTILLLEWILRRRWGML